MIKFLLGAAFGAAATGAAFILKMRYEYKKAVSQMSDAADIAEEMINMINGNIAVDADEWAKIREKVENLDCDYVDMYVDLGNRYSTKRFYMKDVSKLVDSILIAESRGLDYYLMHDNRIIGEI